MATLSSIQEKEGAELFYVFNRLMIPVNQMMKALHLCIMQCVLVITTL